jgi:glycosyltransferase involved in cell wall biosynthesis
MRILHLLYESEGDYFGIGGVGIRAYKIYERLSDRHDITLLCRRYPGAVDGVRRGLRHIHAGRETENFTLTLLSYASGARRYVMEKGESYDIIIEEFSPAVPTFLNTYRKRPVVLQVQGCTGRQYFFKYNPLYSTTLFFLERIRPYFYSRFIFVSDTTRRRYRLPGKADVRIIPNGVDLRDIRRSGGSDRYMLYLGRLDVHNKGLDILLKGFLHLVTQAGFDLKLVIAGDGRDRNELFKLVDALPPDVRSKLDLPGWVEDDRKYDLLQNAEFLVMPSRYESQPIVALEAASAGIPIVASDIGELRFIGENRMGFNFKSGDPLALADRIRHLSGSMHLRDKMGRNARTWAEGFSWDRIAGQFEEYLEEVVRRG